MPTFTFAKSIDLYPIKVIEEVLGAEAILHNEATIIENLLTDSRRIVFPATSLFFALHSTRRDGHSFIEEAYKQGVTNFVIDRLPDLTKFPEANFLLVKDSLKALQQLAAYHRLQFTYPVIGITGSNGKTIVKEWLYQLLSPEYNIIRSPRSYNSQLGVPLSVWQMTAEHNLAIFEAGISQPKEMEALREIIKPSIGILTNIGEAHSEGFENINQKVKEKMQLFRGAELLFANNDSEIINKAVEETGLKITNSWGNNQQDGLQIQTTIKQFNNTTITALYEGKEIKIVIPFTDNASVENAITCWNVCLYFNIAQQDIASRMAQLQPVNMRLQLVQAINGCSLINDSYSFDINSFNIALDFLLQQQQYPRKTVILSDFANAADERFYQQIADILKSKKITRIITVGENWHRRQKLFKDKIKRVQSFKSTRLFLSNFTENQFRNEAILLKGARKFGFERIVAQLENKVHNTVLEINLTSLAHNLNAYQQRMQPGTKLMAMIKASGYGSGSAEIANVLQFQRVDYVAVAYTDEGVELRKAGIHLPVLVLNVDEAAFESIIEHNLEPELFSFNILQAFDNYLFSQGIPQYPVHIKLDTGMHRLGFEEPDLPQLTTILEGTKRLAIKSVFTHLAASEDVAEDPFTLQQYMTFNRCCNNLQMALGYTFIRHIANSAAIFRHPNIQLDMVRLGIGMYGVDSANERQLSLKTVCTLKTTIAQLRKVKAGDTIGYNRKGVVTEDSLIAVIRIGYADGFSRKLSNGNGSVFIKGIMAPVIGNVCMDMTMVNVTAVKDVQEGDEVEVFGANIPVQNVAYQAETIAYEILTGISERVKRVYVEE